MKAVVSGVVVPWQRRGNPGRPLLDLGEVPLLLIVSLPSVSDRPHDPTEESENSNDQAGREHEQQHNQKDASV